MAGAAQQAPQESVNERSVYICCLSHPVDAAPEFEFDQTNEVHALMDISHDIDVVAGESGSQDIARVAVVTFLYSGIDETQKVVADAEGCVLTGHNRHSRSLQAFR
jgi:hypothetical protein